MDAILKEPRFHWTCAKTWKLASKNTSWCLLGCSIGDFGTIAFFQFMELNWSVILIMILAIVNGLFTSILLETMILKRQMELKMAFQTAIGMSLISMISMEVAMNVADEDLFLSLSNRLIRLEKQITESEKEKLLEFSGGKTKPKMFS